MPPAQPGVWLRVTLWRAKPQPPDSARLPLAVNLTRPRAYVLGQAADGWTWPRAAWVGRSASDTEYYGFRMDSIRFTALLTCPTLAAGRYIIYSSAAEPASAASSLRSAASPSVDAAVVPCAALPVHGLLYVPTLHVSPTHMGDALSPPTCGAVGPVVQVITTTAARSVAAALSSPASASPVVASRFGPRAAGTADAFSAAVSCVLSLLDGTDQPATPRAVACVAASCAPAPVDAAVPSQSATCRLRGRVWRLRAL